MVTPELRKKWQTAYRGTRPEQFVTGGQFSPPASLGASPKEHLEKGLYGQRPTDPGALHKAILTDPPVQEALYRHLSAQHPGLNVLKQLGSGVESAAMLVAPNDQTRQITGQSGPVVLKVGISDPVAATAHMTPEQREMYAPAWGVSSTEAQPWWSKTPRKIYTWFEPAMTPLGAGTTDAFRLAGESALSGKSYVASKPTLLAKELQRRGLTPVDLGESEVLDPLTQRQGTPGTYRGPDVAQAGWYQAPGEASPKLRLFDRGAAVPAGEQPAHVDVMTQIGKAGVGHMLDLWQDPQHQNLLRKALAQQIREAPTGVKAFLPSEFAQMGSRIPTKMVQEHMDNLRDAVRLMATGGV
jgi:hypothetical protein